jgi:predicted small secreted protein
MESNQQPNTSWMTINPEDYRNNEVADKDYQGLRTWINNGDNTFTCYKGILHIPEVDGNTSIVPAK